MSGINKIKGRTNEETPENIADVSNSNLHVQVTSTAGNAWNINESGQGHVVMTSTVDSNNSSTTPLSSGGVFTGTTIDILDYSIVNITVFSDVASATDGLSIQQSCDGTNWDIADPYTIQANTGKTFSVQTVCQYFRVVYTNGDTDQTAFRLGVLLKKNMSKPSSHRIQDSISTDDDAELTKAVLTGEDNTQTFRNVTTTQDGDINTNDNSSGLAIAEGNVTGKDYEHKFGNAPDFDTADGEVTVWDGAEDGTTWELMNYVFSTTADIDSISSSSASDTQKIVIEGLDSDWNLVSQTITLNGQTRVALTTNLIRVFRAFNDNSVNLVGHVFVYVNGAITGGIPDTNADIRAIIDPDNQQTEMAVYTIPNDKRAYIRDWYMSTSGGNKASSYVFKLKSRNYNKIFRTKHSSAMDQLAPVPYQHKYEEPEKFAPKTDILMTCESIASPASEGNSISSGFDIVLVDVNKLSTKVLETSADNLGLFYKLNEQTGTNAVDSSSTGINGTYVSATLKDDLYSDGEFCPLFDGINDYVDISTGLASAITNPARGTILICAKLRDSNVWEDNTSRYFFEIGSGGANRILLDKDTIDNRLDFIYRAGGVSDTVSITGLKNDGWMILVATWDKDGSGNSYLWLNGTKYGPTTLTNTPIGTFDDAIIGANRLAGSNFTDGYLSHFAFWDDTVLSDRQIQYLSS